MEMRGKIIWQPHFGPKCDLSVDLDRFFAREMIDARILLTKQNRMNQLASEQLKRLNENLLEPYIFHEDSCFVSQFNLGYNGVWLAADGVRDLIQPREEEKPIKYYSHNVDTYSSISL